MPISSETLPIILSGGIDSKAAPEVVQPPRLLDLVNCTFDRPGMLKKRPGTAPLGTGAPSTGRVLHTHDGLPLVQTPTALYAYAPGPATWTSKGACFALGSTSKTVAQAARGVDLGDVAVSSPVVVTAWRDKGSGLVYALTQDATTGAIVRSAEALSSLAATHLCAIAQDGAVLVLWTDSGGLKGRRLAASSPGSGWGSIVTINSSSAYSGAMALAACTGPAGTVNVAVRRAASGTANNQLIYVNTTTLAATSTATFGTSYTTASGAFVMAWDSAHSRVLLLSEEFVGELHAWVYSSTHVAVGDVKVLDLGPAIVKTASACWNGTGWSVWAGVHPNPLADPKTSYVMVGTVKADGTAVDVALSTVAYGVTVASQAVYVSGYSTGLAWVLQHTGQQSAYYLMTASGTLIGKALALQAADDPNLRGTTSTGAQSPALPALVTSGTHYLSVLGLSTTDDLGASVALRALALADLDPTIRPHSAPQGQSLFIPGSLPQLYDGQALAEAGFLLFPEFTATDASVTGQVVCEQVLLAWAGVVARLVGDQRVPTQKNGRVYEVINAGTTGIGEPTWPTTIGATVIDGTVTWRCVGYYVHAWAAGVTVAAGDMVRPTTRNGYWYTTTGGGTTAGGEPTWPTTIGATVTDNSVTWTCVGLLGRGAQGAGTRSYRACYEWTDAKGQTHRSAPSLALSVASTISSSGASAVTVDTLRLTTKTGVRVVLYRTDNGGTTYRPVASVPNDTSRSSVTIIDSVSDTPAAFWAPSTAYAVGDRVAALSTPGIQGRCTTAGTSSGAEPAWPTALDSTVTDGGVTWTIEQGAKGLTPIYTTGGLGEELENFPPPPCTMAASWQQRLYLAGLETSPAAIAIGKAGATSFPGWSPALVYPLDPAGGAITAIAAMDEKLAAFRRTRIGIVAGSPPNDLLNGSTLQSAMLPLDQGALSMDGVTPAAEGVYFASARGIHLLTRGTALEYVGAPVEGALGSGTIYGCQTMSGQTQVRWVYTSGVLVLDTLTGQWARHSGLTPVDMTLYGDLAVYIDGTQSTVTIETPASWLDGSTAVAQSIETPWIQPAGPLAWIRALHLYVLGTLKDACQWRLEVYRDGGETTAIQHIDTVLTSAITDDGAYGSSGSLRLELSHGLCRSMKFKLIETFDADVSTEGMAWSQVSLEWMPRSKVTKQAAARQKG